jgi:hypothetical protein
VVSQHGHCSGSLHLRSSVVAYAYITMPMHSPHSSLSHGHRVISHPLAKRRVSTNDILRDHIHITSITVYCHKHSTLLLIILLICVTLQITLYHRCICIGKKSTYRFMYYPQFQISMKSWNISHLDKEGRLYII